jgi:hypothetical protein
MVRKANSGIRLRGRRDFENNGEAKTTPSANLVQKPRWILQAPARSCADRSHDEIKPRSRRIARSSMKSKEARDHDYDDYDADDVENIH